MEDIKQYEVVQPVKVGESDLEPGAIVELTAEQLAALPEGSVKPVEAAE